MADYDEYVATLKSFEITTSKPMVVVHTDFINKDVAPDARKELVDYHPLIGSAYMVTAPVKGSGWDSYLEVEPVSGAWNADQRALLAKLHFVPAPIEPAPYRPRVLMMKRSGSGNISLAPSTNWFLVNARIEKTRLPVNGVVTEVNDVVLTWEYQGNMKWPGDPVGKPYLNPVFSCWKW